VFWRVVFGGISYQDALKMDWDDLREAYAYLQLSKLGQGESRKE
jgi:hypothetical protein